jgi:hypothetical protein
VVNRSAFWLLAKGHYPRAKKTDDELEASLKSAENKDEKKQGKKSNRRNSGHAVQPHAEPAQKLEELTWYRIACYHTREFATRRKHLRQQTVLLATKLGTACVEFINQERYGILVPLKAKVWKRYPRPGLQES